MHRRSNVIEAVDMRSRQEQAAYDHILNQLNRDVNNRTNETMNQLSRALFNYLEERKVVLEKTIESSTAQAIKSLMEDPTIDEMVQSKINKSFKAAQITIIALLISNVIVLGLNVITYIYSK